jgi:multiple sugar transport system substrate-binding protein
VQVRRARALLGALLAAAVLMALASCDGDDPPPPGPSTSAPPPPPAKLTFAVWGAEEEIAAYQRVVDDYDSVAEGTEVTIQPYGSHDELMAALDEGDVPDVFMVSRSDLAKLEEDELTRPIGTLLDDRGVDFGDGYSRAALEAFAADRDLQCMPYGISPMVIYYNKELVDFEAMALRGLDVPSNPNDDNARWTLAEFQVAADYATRPRRDTSGFYVAPTLRGLAPFVYAAGGRLFDDDEEPTSLAFSSDDTRSALEEVLPLLRDPKLTLSEGQLSQAPALTWFKRGKLGMIAGFRSMVPELRQVQGLEFDVIAMPTVDDAATVGDITGLCISRATKDVAQSADLLVNLISSESVSAVVRAGYLSPANTRVALSDAFLQAGRQPAHAQVFNSSVRAMRLPPLVADFAALEQAVAVPLEQLLEVAVPNLEVLTTQIDEASRTVLSPEDASASPDD